MMASILPFCLTPFYFKPATFAMPEYQSATYPQSLSPQRNAFAIHHIKLFITALIVSLSTGGVYWLRLNQVVGLAGDDAWYVLLAKSLAQGQGFQLLNSPVPGLLPSYPPAFPYLLSLFLRCSPFLAEHIWGLKVVSVAAMFGIGGATLFYLRRFRQLPFSMAMAVATATVSMPAFVFLATSTVMSECVFTLAQLLTVVIVEKALRKGQGQTLWFWWWGAAALASWTFLTRSIAVSLLAAVVLYLLKERNYKTAMIFAGSTLLFIAPWILYTRAQASTTEAKRMHGGNIVYTYGDQLWMKRAGASNSGTETVRDLPARIWQNTYNIAARDFCGMVFPSLLRSPQESGEETFSLGESDTIGGGSMKGVMATTIVSISLGLLALLGFVVVALRRVTLVEILLPCSLAVIVIWPWWTFRFVLPLAPFFLHYMLVGLMTLSQGAQKLLRQATARDEWAVPRVFIFCVLALFGYDHVSYVRSQMQSLDSSAWISEYKESNEVLEWVRVNLPSETIVASSSPARVFLHSGHKAISCDQPLDNWETWKRLGVQYLVILESHGMTVLDGQETSFPVLYRSVNDMRVINLGPPSGRATPQP